MSYNRNAGRKLLGLRSHSIALLQILWGAYIVHREIFKNRFQMWITKASWCSLLLHFQTKIIKCTLFECPINLRTSVFLSMSCVYTTLVIACEIRAGCRAINKMIFVHCKMTPMSEMRNALSMWSEIIRAYVDKRSKFDILTDFISCRYGLFRNNSFLKNSNFQIKL